MAVVGDPEASIDKLEDDNVTLVAIVPVKPELKISSYKGIKIKEYAYTVSDEEVDAEINRLLDRCTADCNNFNYILTFSKAFRGSIPPFFNRDNRSFNHWLLSFSDNKNLKKSFKAEILRNIDDDA